MISVAGQLGSSALVPPTFTAERPLQALPEPRDPTRCLATHSYYEELLAAGVRVYRYQSPVLLHSKILSIDDDIAVIGSSNMDMRSFQLDLEVTLVCYNRQVVVDMQQVVDDYLRHSRPLQLGTWQARPLLIKLFDNLARLTSALQ
jgi:cardiolipin synthase A/B